MKKIPSAAERRALLKSIVASPVYQKAYQDLEFMGREELRPVRLQLELLKPEMVLTEHDIRSTIVVFGSARLQPADLARRRVAELSRRLSRRPGDAVLRRRLSAAQRLLERSRYYDEARRFGEIVTRASQKDRSLDFVVVTGGGPGVMEAANLGAYDARGKSIGLNITLPHEQTPNPYITPELCFQFHYFALRKMHFLMRAKAMVAFPGGFGTFDELFETLTLVQTGKKARLPILLFGREYWTRVINLNYLASEGMIAHEDLDLLRYVETAEEAWRAIQEYWKRDGTFDARRRRSFSAGRLDG